MNNNYFTDTFPEGTIYVQLRYFSPYPVDECYESLILTINKDGDMTQRVELYNKSGINFFNAWTACSKDDFEKFQEKIIGVGAKQEWYNKYYQQWKEYYLAKKKSLESTKKQKPPNTWYYCKILEQEDINNGLQPKKEALQSLESQLRQLNNPSISDFYREARQQATMDYITNKI